MAEATLSASPPAFSASDAAVDGFRVIREQWRLMVGWAVFNFLALLVLVVVSVIILLIVAASGGSTLAAGLLSAVTGLAALTIQVMIVTALYRVLLRFEEPGFLHLRLGPDELRMLAVWLATGFGAILWIGVSTAFTAWVQRMTSTPPAFVAGLACFAALVYLLTRLSLTAPLTFDTHRFGFAGSWRLTRGRMIPLLGMTAITLCLLALMAVVGWFVLFLVVGASSGFHHMGLAELSDGEALKSRPLAWVVQMAGELLYGPLFLALALAPQVAAYKAFANRR